MKPYSLYPTMCPDFLPDGTLRWDFTGYIHHVVFFCWPRINFTLTFSKEALQEGGWRRGSDIRDSNPNSTIYELYNFACII